MNYLKITQYIYLAFAAFFIYDGVLKYNEGQSPWLSFGFAALGIFLFFFRRHFAKRFEERKRNNEPKP